MRYLGKITNEQFAGKEDIIKGGESEIMSFDHLPSIKKLYTNNF